MYIFILSSKVFLQCNALQLETYLGSGSRIHSQRQNGCDGYCAYWTALNPYHGRTPPARRKGWWGWSPGWSRWQAASASCWCSCPSCSCPFEELRLGKGLLLLKTPGQKIWFNTVFLTQTLGCPLCKDQLVCVCVWGWRRLPDKQKSFTCVFLFSWVTPTGPKKGMHSHG